MYYLFLFIAIIFNVIAQLLLKIVATKPELNTAGVQAIAKIKLLLPTPEFWGALFFYGISFVLYTLVLSKIEVSRAYPISSIGAIILILIFSSLFMNEAVTAAKLAGILLCFAGILLIFR